MVKNAKKSWVVKKKFEENGIGNQGSYKKVLEKEEKKFCRIKKVRTFALAIETGRYPRRDCESRLKSQKPKVACL